MFRQLASVLRGSAAAAHRPFDAIDTAHLRRVVADDRAEPEHVAPAANPGVRAMPELVRAADAPARRASAARAGPRVD